MHVLRNTYKSRQIAYEDDAYNLPLDTIYFIESKWNYRLNEYVRAHQQEIEQFLRNNDEGLFQYKFEIVSLRNLENPIIQKAILDLHPEWEHPLDFTPRSDFLDRDQEQLYQSVMLQRMTTDRDAFDITFMARLLPAEYSDTHDFYAIDTSLCSESLIFDIFKKFVHYLDYTNLSLYGEQEFWRDYKTHDEVLPLDGSISFGSNHSLVHTEIDKLNINPQLRDLALKLKDEVDSYQRTNGINVLLENQFAEFVKSFERFEVKPLSSLEIDSTYHIHLPEYKKEVKMYTMPKTVYFFFLRHPQGIYLKDITDYRQELIQIYWLLTKKGESFAECVSQIDKLIDTTQSNLLNQYMSRVSEAFRNVLSTEMSKNYIISGKRNELYRIKLDADKVTLPENLKSLNAMLRI